MSTRPHQMFHNHVFKPGSALGSWNPAIPKSPNLPLPSESNMTFSYPGAKLIGSCMQVVRIEILCNHERDGFQLWNKYWSRLPQGMYSDTRSNSPFLLQYLRRGTKFLCCKLPIVTTSDTNCFIPCSASCDSRLTAKCLLWGRVPL